MTDSIENDLRRDARKIFLAAVHAAEPGPLVHAALLNAPELRRGARVTIIAAGKAAPGMAVAALETIGEHVHACLVVAPAASLESAAASLKAPIVRTIAAGHPLPDEASVTAGRTALNLASHAADDDVIVVLLSGGASALLAVPAIRLTLEDYRATTALLQTCGATIEELNCVRKHIDDVKGGRLAFAARAGSILGLIMSDVIGDRIDVIASGPISADPTTYADALDVLRRYDIIASTPEVVLQRLRAGAEGDIEDTPAQDDPCLARVRTQVIADNAHAVDAATAYARRLGYDVARIAEPVTGDAAAAGRLLGSQLANGATQSRRADRVCFVAGGETTVNVHGDGKGGRNQELALAAALQIEGMAGVVLLSGGTDGIDGPTDAAGAIVDGNSVARMRSAGIDPAGALARNDSYTALNASNDLLVTGATGTNVIDVQIMIRGNVHDV